MKFIHIQPADLESAKDYVPMLKKLEFVDYASVRCIDKIAVSVEGAENTGNVPPMYKINRDRMHRYLMGAFVKLYLKRQYDPIEGDEWLMSMDDFDRWNGGHLFPEIDRMKHIADLRDKVFDVLSDYRALKTLLIDETEGMLAVMNDPTTRILSALTTPADPKALKDSIKELEALKTQLEDYKAEHKG